MNAVQIQIQIDDLEAEILSRQVKLVKLRRELLAAITPAPKRARTPVVAPPPPPRKPIELPKSWCDQCDRMVLTAEAQKCQSRFCSIKRK